MAASGRIIGSYLPGRGQRLEIDWTQTPDPATHTSTVSCMVYVRHQSTVGNYDNRQALTADCTGLTRQTLQSLAWTSHGAADALQELSDGPITWAISCDAAGVHSPVTLTFRYQYKGEAWVTASEEIQLDPVPLASTISSVTGVITAGQPYGVSIVRHIDTYWHKLTISVNNTAVFVSDAFKAGYMGTSELSWLAQMPSSTTGYITYRLVTYSDEACTTQVGGASTATGMIRCPDSAGPTGTGWATISPDNSGTPGAGSISAYITDISQASATITIGAQGVSAQYGATLASATITCGGSTVTATITPDAASVTVKAVAPSQAGQYTVTVRVTDSRGLSATETATVTYQTWLPPVLTTAVAQRWDTTLVDHNMGTDIRVTASATCADIIDSGGTDINSVTLSASYRQAGTSTWTDYSGTITDGSPVVITGGNISTTHSYEVRIRATDVLWITDQIITVPKSSVTLNFLPGGDGAAFGGYATQDGLTIFWSHIDAPNFATGGILIKAQDANGVAKTFRVLGVEVSTP